MGCCESTQKADDGKLPQGSGGVELEKKTVVLTVEDPAAEAQGRSIRDDYQIQKRIGQGNYSTVHLAVHRRTREKVAVKIAKKANLTQEDIDAVYVEVDVLRELDHPHVVKLKAFYEDETHFFLVMELLTGGELLERLLERSIYTEEEARRMMVTLLQAINYCHSKGVVHRDLKLENVLLESTDENAPVKIADFGFAKRFASFKDLTTSCGTPGYVAPEVLSSRSAWYGPKVDVWSLGVIMYILLVGYPPFTADNQAHLFRKIKRGDYSVESEGWESVSEEAKDLVRKLLTVNADARVSPQQALNHPWLSARLAGGDLPRTREQLTSYLARRRLKRTFFVVQAANKLKRTMTASSSGTGTGLASLVDRARAAADETKTADGAAPAGTEDGKHVANGTNQASSSDPATETTPTPTPTPTPHVESEATVAAVAAAAAAAPVPSPPSGDGEPPATADASVEQPSLQTE